MTELEQAQFASELLNGLAPLITGSFLLGLLTGVFFFGRIADFIDRLGSSFRRPQRIKRAFSDGDFEYLYLLRGVYHTKDQYEKLVSYRRFKGSKE